MTTVKFQPGEVWMSQTGESKRTRIAEFFCSLLLALGLFAFFVAVYFFTIASKLEAVAVKMNTDRVVSEMLGPIVNLLPVGQKEQIRTHIQFLKPPDMESTDQQVATSNKNLIRNVMLIMSAGLVFILLVIFLVWVGMYLRHKRDPKAPEPFDSKMLFIQQGIMLGFVALTEGLFLGGIGIWYRSVDTNDIRRSVSESFVKFIKS
jgi:predicted PurR-regulated permease PerM